jgi:hypothetical protein
MKNTDCFNITREKHLDHMVKVVPFIVFCYALQCYFIMKLSPTEFSSISLSILGGFLAFMIAGFITYDLKHHVTLFENHLEIHFLSSSKSVSFDDIWSVEVKDPGQSFATVTLLTKNGKVSLFFVDDAEKIKKIIESKKHSDLMAA